MFLPIPAADEVSDRLGLTRDEVSALVEAHGLPIYYAAGRELLLASEVFGAIHGSKAPSKFAKILAQYPSCHVDVAPINMEPLVLKVHDPVELLRYLDDLSAIPVFLGFTRESVNIYKRPRCKQ